MIILFIWEEILQEITYEAILVILLLFNCKGYQMCGHCPHLSTILSMFIDVSSNTNERISSVVELMGQAGDMYILVVFSS